MQKVAFPTEGVYSYVEEESGLIKKRSRSSSLFVVCAKFISPEPS